MKKQKHHYQNHKKHKIGFLIVLLIVVVIWAGYETFSFVKEAQTIEYPVKVSYGVTLDLIHNETYYQEIESGQRRVGIIQPPMTLNFFKMMPGMNETTRIKINNSFGIPIKIETELTGNISQYLTEEFEGVMQTGEAQEIMLTLKVPEEGTLEGRYRGNFTILISPK